MMNRYLASTAFAASLALSAGAFAQTSTQPQQRAPSTTTPSTQTQNGATVLLQESMDDYLARQDLIGTNVRNAQNEKIGDVEDVVFDRNGRVKGVVVGVGGFLGMGEKHVALAWNELQVRPPAERSGTADTSRAASSRHPDLVANVTKDQLRQAPEFKRVTDMRRDTTGRTPNGTTGTTRTAPSTTQ
jgi:sporulation protein YlmC with PRC-barrel domain